MSNNFFTNGMGLDEMIQAVGEGNLPDSLIVISQIEEVISLLHRQWCGNFIGNQEHIMRLLRNSQELVRKAHEAEWREHNHASLSQ